MHEPLLHQNSTENDAATPGPTTHTDSENDLPQHQDEIRQPRGRSSTRILDRDAAFFQSRGRWSIEHVSRSVAGWNDASEREPYRKRLKRFWNDWFYVLAYQRTIVLIAILFCVYTAIVIVFAILFLSVSLMGQEQQTNEDGSISEVTFCDMDIHNHMEALYFSLSTMAAIGYGVSDYYFGGCWTPLLLVLAQACSAIIFHAIAVGILFQRISRGHKRGKTILFSNKAIIRRVKGIPYLMFRVAELRHHQLLEATVRAYCVRHERHAATRTDCEHKEESQGLNFPAETVHYVSRPMKLLHEEVGASRILMSLPQVVAHIIDEKSPLMPLIPAWYDVQGRSHCQQNGLFTSEDIALFWRDRDVEVVVLLEGTDELTGAAIQAKHSYSADDFAWNETFVPCVRPFVQTGDTEIRRRLRRRWGRNNASNSPVCLVDFSIFHETTPAPLDCDSCAYIE